MLRTLDRYILREIAVPFLLGLGIFTLILLIARILKLVEMVVNRGVPFIDVVRLFSYILPSFLEVTVPMALLLAVLAGLGRLSADSEVVALRASGIGLLRLSRPIAVFALLTFGAAMILSIYARPWGNSLLRDGLFEIAKVRASAGIRAKVFNNEFSDLVLYVDQLQPPGNVLHGVLIAGSLAPTGSAGAALGGGPSMQNTVVAKAGVLIPNEELHVLTLRLFEGSLHSLRKDEQTYDRTDFGTYDITLDLDAALADLHRSEREPKERSTSELRAMAERPDQSGLEAAVELARRFSLPFACLGFAAIAVPLGVRPSSGARARSFSLSIALIFGYYLLLTLGESLATRRVLPTTIALWIPNLVLAALASTLIWREVRGAPRGGDSRIAQFTQELARRFGRKPN